MPVQVFDNVFATNLDTDTASSAPLRGSRRRRRPHAPRPLPSRSASIGRRGGRPARLPRRHRCHPFKRATRGGDGSGCRDHRLARTATRRSRRPPLRSHRRARALATGRGARARRSVSRRRSARPLPLRPPTRDRDPARAPRLQLTARMRTFDAAWASSRTERTRPLPSPRRTGRSGHRRSRPRRLKQHNANPTPRSRRPTADARSPDVGE